MASGDGKRDLEVESESSQEKKKTVSRDVRTHLDLSNHGIEPKTLPNVFRLIEHTQSCRVDLSRNRLACLNVSDDAYDTTGKRGAFPACVRELDLGHNKLDLIVGFVEEGAVGKGSEFDKGKGGEERAFPLRRYNVDCRSSLRRLTALLALNLSHNNLKEVVGIEKLVSLLYLDVSHNKVRSLLSN